MGRPTLYTEELANSICDQIAQGIPLTEILSAEGMPGRTTVYDWLHDEDNKSFSEHFARAREVGFDVIAEDALDIADDGTNDWMKRRGKDKEEYWELNGEHVQRSKLRIETRLKLLAKWDPKRYGDRMDLTSGGEKMNNAPPVFNVYNVGPPMASSEDEIDLNKDV